MAPDRRDAVRPSLSRDAGNNDSSGSEDFSPDFFYDTAARIEQVNRQTLLFAGYGDDRTLEPDASLVRANRTFFLKVSYALQR